MVIISLLVFKVALFITGNCVFREKGHWETGDLSNITLTLADGREK